MVVGRFAPSPSGRMHLGNLACCLLAWLDARAAGGRVVLRIEDLDAERCPRRWADLLEEDLHWLGLDWDEGGAAGGPHGPYYQSQRAGLYAAACEELARQGLVYPCFCTRSLLRGASAPHRADGQVIYPGTCRGLPAAEVARRLAAGEGAALRLRVPDETIHFTDGHLGPCSQYLPADCGDFSLRRADGVHTYQLAVVVDDAAMGVTHVVRGQDLAASTPRQLLLYRLLGLPAPQFFHLPLLLAPDGRRLSKRDEDLGIPALRGRCTPAQLVGRLAQLYGFHSSGAPCTPAQLVADFSWEKVPKEDIRLPADWF